MGEHTDAGPALVAIARIAAASAVDEDVASAEAQLHGESVVVAVASPSPHPNVTAIDQSETLVRAKDEEPSFAKAFAADSDPSPR